MSRMSWTHLCLEVIKPAHGWAGLAGRVKKLMVAGIVIYARACSPAAKGLGAAPLRHFRRTRHI